MAALATMKQLEERQVEHEVKLLAWSPKMDILAVGLFNGDVALYRINWQKVKVPVLSVTDVVPVQARSVGQSYSQTASQQRPFFADMDGYGAGRLHLRMLQLEARRQEPGGGLLFRPRLHPGHREERPRPHHRRGPGRPAKLRQMDDAQPADGGRVRTL